MQIVDISLLFTGFYVINVYVCDDAAHDFRLASVVLQDEVFAFQLFCFLETQLLGQFGHFFLQLQFYFPCITLQYLLSFVYPTHVFLVTYLSDAHACAVLDVVVETLSVSFIGHSIGSNRRFAAPERVEVLDEFQQHVHRLYVTVGAEIGACLAVYLSCLEDAWEVFVRYDDAGIGLTVFEQDVVFGIPLLDEVVLQQQGIFLRVHHDILDVPNVLHQTSCLQALLLLLEVARYPSFQPFGLTHIYDCARIIEILVTSG